MHQANHATGLLEAFVFLELANEFAQIGMKRVRIHYAGKQRLGRCGGQAHLHGLAQRFAVGLSHFFDLSLRCHLREQAFAQNVIQLVTVRVDWRDGHGNAPGL